MHLVPFSYVLVNESLKQKGADGNEQGKRKQKKAQTKKA